MKKLYIILILISPIICFSQALISVDFTVTDDGDGKKLIEVSYCATGAFTVDGGADDWAGQVITIGFEPSSDITASAPNPNPDFT